MSIDQQHVENSGQKMGDALLGEKVCEWLETKISCPKCGASGGKELTLTTYKGFTYIVCLKCEHAF